LERRLERAVGFAFLDKHRSEGVVRSGALAGEVSDRVAIVVDDLISSGTTLARAESTCRAHGARATYAAATHGLFSAEAGRVLGQSAFARIFVLDSTPGRALSPELARRVTMLDCAPLLAAAIQRLHTDGSLSELCDAGLTTSAARA
jgi:ribose-phosphate pyrophosphokinase